MKIYPSQHNVCEEERPRFLDIPLAHIEKHYIPKKVVVETAPEMTHSESMFIAPYRRFSDDNFLIFTDDGKISKTKLQRKDGAYIYMPPDIKEYSPTEFSYSILVKRSTSIKSDRNYNFRVGVYDTDGAKEFANKLVSICGDAPYRGIAPSNIFVNNGSTKITDMMTQDGKGFDFVFIQGSSTEFLENEKGKIPYESFYDSHANLWVTLTDDGCQKCFDMMDDGESYLAEGINSTQDGFAVFEAKNKKAASVFFNSKNYGYRAKKDPVVKGIEKYQWNQLMPHRTDGKTPIIIMERPGGGYLVVSHKNLFEHLDEFAPFVYNVLEELYVKSYQKTSEHTAWVTSDPVDYMCSLDVPFRRKYPVANADEIVKDDIPCADGYELCAVEIDNNKVLFSGSSKNGELQFRKVSRTEPEKEPGETTIYTYKHTVISYRGEKDKIVESGVQIGTSVQDDGRCTVTVLPFASSKYSLLSTESLTFELTDVSERYVLRALPVNKDGKSVVSLVPEGANEDGSGAVVLATVYTEFEGEPAAYDVRQLGGGLPEGYTDYDMMDIGNPKGRPYRVGTGAVITLPKAYEKYDERIRKAVESYKVAADQFYIIYRDE